MSDRFSFITSRVSGRGNVFGSVRLSVCVLHSKFQVEVITRMNILQLNIQGVLTYPVRLCHGLKQVSNKLQNVFVRSEASGYHAILDSLLFIS